MKRKKFEKLRIVSSNYTITYHDEIRDKNDILLDGHILESEQLIKICAGLSYERTLQVILHEAMHGMKWELTLKRDDSSDDETVNILLTTGIGCFIRDNPEFVKELIRVLNR